MNPYLNQPLNQRAVRAFGRYRFQDYSRHFRTNCKSQPGTPLHARSALYGGNDQFYLIWLHFLYQPRGRSLQYAVWFAGPLPGTLPPSTWPWLSAYPVRWWIIVWVSTTLLFQVLLLHWGVLQASKHNSFHIFLKTSENRKCHLDLTFCPFCRPSQRAFL